MLVKIPFFLFFFFFHTLSHSLPSSSHTNNALLLRGVGIPNCLLLCQIRVVIIVVTISRWAASDNTDYIESSPRLGDGRHRPTGGIFVQCRGLWTSPPPPRLPAPEWLTWRQAAMPAHPPAPSLLCVTQFKGWVPLRPFWENTKTPRLRASLGELSPSWARTSTALPSAPRRYFRTLPGVWDDSPSAACLRVTHMAVSCRISPRLLRGTSPPPRGRMSTPVKHPQLPQLPQHHQPPCSTANENSSWAHLPDQPDPGRLYKRAHSSISKESTTRSRRDNFSGSNLSFSSKQSYRDYFSGLPCWAINKKQYLMTHTENLSQSGCRQETDPILTPPRAALPDVAIEVGPEPPEVASTSRTPREDQPPVILEIPCSSPEPDKLSEPLQCPDTPGKWFQPPSRGSKRPRSSPPPSPRCPRKRYSSHGR